MKERRKGSNKDLPQKKTVFEAPSKMGNAILSNDWENDIFKVGLPRLQDWSGMRTFGVPIPKGGTPITN